MKIGFVGPAKAGKTTTAHQLYCQLKDDGYNVGLLPETARETLQRMKVSLYEIRDDPQLFEQFQRAIMMRQLELEDRMAKQHDIVICDRTVYDVMLYVVFYGHLDFVLEFIETYSWDLKKPRYDWLFVFQPVDRQDEDPMRHEEDIHWSGTHERMLIRWLHNHRWVYVPMMSVAERVSYIRRVIQL